MENWKKKLLQKIADGGRGYNDNSHTRSILINRRWVKYSHCKREREKNKRLIEERKNEKDMKRNREYERQIKKR